MIQEKNNKKNIAIQKPTITRDTQIEIMKFFYKTTVPRILKSKPKN